MTNLEKLPEFDGHEMVLRIQDPSTGLRGFIAVHNTNLGPAVGGTRFWYYKNEEEALRDALRLSKAMTYKCALANLPYGGGKAVLMAPRDMKERTKTKSEHYLSSYASRLALLDGHFFTGEDVGMEEHDIEVLARKSTSIIGRPSVGGLPSPFAARSVFESMRAALRVSYDNDSFENRTVAIKGLGNVGLDLAKLLVRAGATVIGADVNEDRVKLAQKKVPGIKIVSPAVIHKQEADIYSPCALGSDLTAAYIHELKCQIVCGSANNQLATPSDSYRLFKKGIVYIPDYVANAGGLITVVDELHAGGYDRDRVRRHIAQIKETVTYILTEAREKKLPADKVADMLAEKRFHLTR